jgi:chloride channel 3/4/5
MRAHMPTGKMREILTASSAAGVAVAFGAPVGGVLFSIEEMSGTLRARTLGRAFACALAATVTLAAINPFRTGKLVLFQVTYDRDWHFFEIIFFIVLGIFGVRGTSISSHNMN